MRWNLSLLSRKPISIWTWQLCMCGRRCSVVNRRVGREQANRDWRIWLKRLSCRKSTSRSQASPNVPKAFTHGTKHTVLAKEGPALPHDLSIHCVNPLAPLSYLYVVLKPCYPEAPTFIFNSDLEYAHLLLLKLIPPFYARKVSKSL